MSSNPYIGSRVGFDTERSVSAPFSGSAQLLGTPLDFPAVIATFDNQSTVSVVVAANGINWKTFVAGEAMVLDLRANHGNASTYVIDQNTQFTVTGTAGTGAFKLSINYAR